MKSGMMLSASYPIFARYLGGDPLFSTGIPGQQAVVIQVQKQGVQHPNLIIEIPPVWIDQFIDFAQAIIQRIAVNKERIRRGGGFAVLQQIAEHRLRVLAVVIFIMGNQHFGIRVLKKGRVCGFCQL
jgi:hypothetical protein